MMILIKKRHYLLFIMLSFSVIQHVMAQNFYKWVDRNGSTHYTTTPPPKNAKTLSTVATYQDGNMATNQASTKKEQTHHANPKLPQMHKVELTAAERAEIEVQVKQLWQKNKQPPIEQDPNAHIFGTTTEQDIRASLESAYLQKKEKLARTSQP